MIPQTYVRFSAPVTLRLAIRQRIIPAPPALPATTPAASHMQTFSALPIWLQIDSRERTITAYLSPIPRGIILYGPADFSAACADPMDDHAARVLQLLGSDPAPALQALIDGTLLPTPPPRVPREVAHWRIAHILSEDGELAAAEDFIASIPPPDGAIAAAAWAGKSAVARSSALVIAVAASLGYSASDMDAVFIRAEAIPT